MKPFGRIYDRHAAKTKAGREQGCATPGKTSHALRFQCRWYEPNEDGDREQKSRSFATREEAVRFLATCQALIAKTSADDILHDRHFGTPALLADQIPLYFDWRLQVGRSRAGAISIRSVLRRLLDQKMPVHVHDISYAMLASVASFWRERSDSGRGPITKIQTFLRIVRKQGVRIDPKALDLKPTEIGEVSDPIKIGVWTESHMQTLFREIMKPNWNADPKTPDMGLRNVRSAASVFYTQRRRFAPIFLLLIRYALRPIEACRLNVRDWDSANRGLRLPRGIRKQRSQDWIIYLDTLTAQIIDHCIQGRPGHCPLFENPYSLGTYEDKRYTTKILWLICRKVLEAGKIPGSLYWTRHYACTYLCRKYAGDLDLVARISGHKDKRQLLRYILTPDDRQRVVLDHYDDLNKSSNRAWSASGLEAFVGMTPEDAARIRSEVPALCFAGRANSDPNAAGIDASPPATPMPSSMESDVLASLVTEYRVHA